MFRTAVGERELFCRRKVGASSEDPARSPPVTRAPPSKQSKRNASPGNRHRPFIKRQLTQTQLPSLPSSQEPICTAAIFHDLSTMLSSMLGPAMLLLASAVRAQETPSVVTFISISPVPTTEEVFTIQTSVPGTLTTPCYEVCVQEPCTACAPPPPASTGLSTGTLTQPGPSDPLMSIPAGETPLPSESVASIITDPIRPSDSGVMGIPSGETPISTGSLDIPASLSPTSRPSLSVNSTARPSLSSSAPPQQSTNAASPGMMGDAVPFVVALAGAAVALL